MEVLDPGHLYKLDVFDDLPHPLGPTTQTLKFVKRKGENYPGNTSAYPGTLIQEVLRALIDRLKYVDNQIPDVSNTQSILQLRLVLLNLEIRAAKRHGYLFRLPFDPIETITPDSQNGHLTSCWYKEE